MNIENNIEIVSVRVHCNLTVTKCRVASCHCQRFNLSHRLTRCQTRVAPADTESLHVTFSDTVSPVLVSGWPPPAVSWTRDDVSVAGSWFTAPDGWSRSELALGPLTRADLGSRVTCRATYHAGYPPKLATAAVDMLRE